VSHRLVFVEIGLQSTDVVGGMGTSLDDLAKLLIQICDRLPPPDAPAAGSTRYNWGAACRP
jgi:hypothetical protein